MKKSIYFLPILFAFSCSSPSENSNTAEKDTTTVMFSDAREPNIVGEEVLYSADGIEMKGYLAYNADNSDAKPGILVVHEWWGHNAHSREQAKRLAELGYVALAVDMYGDGKQASHPKEAGEFAGMVMGNLDGAQARFKAAYDLLKSNSNVNPDKIGAVGYCFGGSVVLTMANLGMDLDAVAAIHAGVQLPVMPGDKLQSKVLVCNGEADPMISADQANTYKSAMDNVGASYEYISYPNVKHAFTNPKADSLGALYQLPLAYNAEADKDSWERIENLFATTF